MNHFLHGTMDLSGPALTLSASVFSTELIQSEAPYICSQGFSTWGQKGCRLYLGGCAGARDPLRYDSSFIAELFGRAAVSRKSSSFLHIPVPIFTLCFLVVSLLFKLSSERHQRTQWSAQVKCYCFCLSHTPFHPQRTSVKTKCVNAFAANCVFF